jgi:hypothetical protein
MSVRERASGATRMTSYVLAVLLAMGFPGPGLVLGAGAATAPVPAATLSVESDPPGAAVLVDGQPSGITPVTFRALPPGDHRVRVVKEGFLENSRLVRLDAGRGERIQVKLTRHAATPATTQTEPEEQKGGGGKKWVFIGLGAAALGAGAYILLTKNSAPVPGTIGVSPSGVGMAGITSYTFTSQGASDPDNDTLTYEWSFGDGTTGTGQTVTKVYGNPGSFGVSLTVADKKHRVSAPGATVTVARSMAGTWTGGLHPGFVSTPTNISVTLTQTGTTLGGTITYSGGLTGSVTGITGTVSGTTYPTTVNFSTPTIGLGGGATMRDTFQGSAASNGNSMTGTYTSTLGGGFTWVATGTPTAARSNTFSR